MTSPPSPNYPCPCGSGRKFKHCCGDVTARRESKSNRLMVAIGVGIMATAAAAAIVVLADFVGERQPAQPTPAETTVPFRFGGPTSQPAGPAPPGKVWSPEHGHWHDAPVDSAAASPTATAVGPPYPQPPEPPPPGKVWSPEHGHWHNDLTAAEPATPPAVAPLLMSSPEVPVLDSL
jgi:hypothetical protein